ncbi:MAG: tRNA preQ1(34) S-adenosylmethionine ribosyltransferase-isomerase QueA [Calditrichaeota bacterium]|nr:MAG: tRNA preQ1(34) S-adenosylmethionine ribosyltransferase-isomerase QueA [Calditrichota bacterium]
MDINLFDYNLPEELIAQTPAHNRDESRLLILDRKSGSTEISSFQHIIDYINPGDCLVVNNTKVFKARLLGNRATGGEVEVFLVRRKNDTLFWEALVQPSRRLNEGEEIFFHKSCHTDKLSLQLLKNKGEGKWEIQFHSKLSEEKIIERYGHVPLPQYIKRSDAPEDVSRYQTIFAKADKTGAVAAPTAGFHFTDSILEQLMAKNVNIAELTLHVGPGTFKPVSVDDIRNHSVDPEYAVLNQKTADLINEAKKRGNKIIAVGTTSTRTLESAEVDKNGYIMPFEKFVDLYIQPGYKFKVVDHLITNFHLPKSSLLILVSAFAGREQIIEAYQKAIENKFCFYSYGDAMLIL